MQITPDTVALVTGGAQGLGNTTARRLVKAGAKVVLVDLPGDAGEQAAQAINEEHGASADAPMALFAGADVRDEEQVAAAVARAAELGTLRIAVNCAGVATPGKILGRKGVLPLEKYKTVIDINLVGTFNVLRLAAEAMAANEPVEDERGQGDRGVIVNTASVAAYDGQIGQAAYASSKGAIASLTLPAARDLAASQIRVMTIAPGVMETPMMAGMPGDVKETLEALVPHPARLGKPEEYAALVEHIVANPLLNGEVIRLDGALRMPPK
ncbi:NAD(P)-dependent dehydrogenase, short-chain alcohol dehydrogenase family [Kytococcus aerolatus]|uniref:NAD(P)-dependent dehydrogenase, short-chain alcohol dehydrogenase family n=1 Tax=Kytococcus aerolatus TaxID=592308 RepID=A0A212TBM2_9MICO|nr:SDR family NAD(P)-dependent oxidoreductase [Kytococcus aerolatus]SNC63236.1 NAD(P)-dependent dehydrogenase, short-chain alcohol dehydrogenase family [Kytococcus aerolatus]